MKILISYFFLSLSLVCSIVHATPRIAPPIQQLNPDKKPSQSEVQAGAVVLYKDVQLKVTPDGTTSGSSYFAIKILDKKAVNDYGQLSITYNSYYESIDLDFARIITRDGKTKDIESDATQIQTGGRDQFFDNTKRLKFSLPALTPGSIIEYQYSFKDIKPVIENNWTTSRHFHYIQAIPNSEWYRVDPVRTSKYQVTIPKQKKLLISEHNISRRVNETVTGDTRVYSWQLNNLPQVKIEPYMPDLFQFLSHVNLSTLTSWSDIAEWSLKQINPKIESTPDIKALAEKLTANKASTLEKTKSIYNYVQENIKYVYAHVDANGYTPHAASEVLANHYGDCKDQTVLMVSLLRASGVQAYPALTNSFKTQTDSSIPYLNFNHMLVFVPELKQTQWIDTSGDTGVFPGTHPGLEGNSSLVVDHQRALMQIPYSRAEDNNIKYLADVHLEPDEENIMVNISIAFSGVFDTYFRSRYETSQNRKNDLFQYFANFYNQGTVISAESTDSRDLEQPLIFTAKVKLPEKKTLDEITIGGSIQRLLATFSSLSDLPLPSERTHDYITNFLYQIESTTRFTTLNSGRHVQILKTGANYDNPFFSIKYGSASTDNFTELNARFVSKTTHVSKKEYDAFYLAADHSERQADSVMVAKKDLDKTMPQTVAGKSGDVTQILAQAEFALEQAEFEKAKKLALESLKLDAANAQAYYILGVSSGLLDDYATSDKYLKKAQELGYQP